MSVDYEVSMSSTVSSTKEIFNVNDNYTQNFTMDSLTIPLARKLAIAAFMDFRPEMKLTHNTIYNGGSIIVDYDRQKCNPNVQVSMMRDSVKSSNFRSEFKWWRRFISLLSATWKRFSVMNQ